MINQMEGLQVGQWSQQESNMWNQQSQINQQSQQMAAWKFVLYILFYLNIFCVPYLGLLNSKLNQNDFEQVFIKTRSYEFSVIVNKLLYLEQSKM